MSDKVSDERLLLEYSIIGCMIKHQGAAGRIIAILSPEDFGESTARTVFVAVRKIFNRNEPIDKLTIVHEIGSDDYGSMIQGCVDIAVPAGNAELYANLLRDRSRLADIQSAAMDLLSLTDIKDVGDCIDKLNGLNVSRRKWEAIPLADALNDFMERRQKENKPEYLDFGFPKLNNAVYAERGDLIIIAGDPSSGKTALAAQMVFHLARKNRVGFFTLETSSAKLTDRMVAQLAKVPLPKIKHNNISPPEWNSISEAAQSVYNLPIEEIPAAGMSADDIRSFSLSRKYDVIFIDYLQLIRPQNAKAQRFEQVTQISMALHTMAQQNGIAVIALSQLSRPDKKTKPQPPTMHDLRESGQIEQDADAVLLLYRRDANNNEGPRVLKVGKNKEGQLIDFDLEFNGEIQTFEESKVRWTPPQKKQPETASQQPMLYDLPDDGWEVPF